MGTAMVFTPARDGGFAPPSLYPAQETIDSVIRNNSANLMGKW
jgi:hypothetical protein